MKRENIVRGMVFSNGSEILTLIEKDNRNIWTVDVQNGAQDEYIRHDYIFTDKSHGYELIGFNIEGQIFGEIPDYYTVILF